MAVEDRNFSNYEWGDNVYELAGGVIREAAGRLDVQLGNEPSGEALDMLVRTTGRNKVLRDNEEVTAIDLSTAVSLVERSHVQDALNRSFVRSDIVVAGDPRPEHAARRLESGVRAVEVNAGASTGAVPNWMDRSTALWTRLALDVPVFHPTGVRVMDRPSDTAHPEVQRLHRRFGRYPSEAEFVGTVVVPRLMQAVIDVLPTTYPTEKGDEIAEQFFGQNPQLLSQRLAVARVGNAGIQLAVQFRDAARKYDRDYDGDPNNPQLFVLTDTLPLARTREQIADPRHYQSPYTAMRQMALTAKLLHQAMGE